MRYALPAAAVAVAGIYGLVVLQRSGWGVAMPEVKVPRILPENLTMDRPHYEGFDGSGGRYAVSAISAQQDFSATNVIKLNGISATLRDASDARTELQAQRGVFDTQSRRLDLSDEIEITSTNGMKARLKTATVDVGESIVTSSDPVVVEMTAGTMRARELKFRHKAREVTFLGTVETHLNAGRAGASDAAPSAPRPFGASDQPIDITSNRLDINDQSKLAVFSGAVRAVQGGSTLSSPDLHVSYAGQAPGLSAPGTKSVSAAPAEPGKIQRITATGPVVMTQATGERATSDSADFDAINARAYLVGQVVMTQAADRRATSDRAELDQRADTVLLLGNVIVSQGRNELKGQRLVSERKVGLTRVTAAAADGGNGRIFARFFRDAPTSAGTAKDGVKAALAKTIGANFRTDPSAPIDINAESLEINDQRKAAVFQGDVQAVQGGFTLRTAEMTAFYNGEAGLGDGAGAADGRSPAKAAAELQRIEAKRSVAVQSRDGQNATGDWATYDTKRNTVTLGGDVVLTQGQNVVRGSRLVIDMTSGQSVIETDPAAAWSARAQPAASQTNGKDAGGKGSGGTAAGLEVPVVGGRPSAIFYPKSFKKKSPADGTPAPEAAATTEKAPAEARPAPATKTDAWGPVTRQTDDRSN